LERRLPLTWSALLDEGAAGLRAGRSSARLDPRREAGILLRAASGLDAAALVVHAGEAADPQAAARFSTWVESRAQGVPLQHLLGETGFHGVTLRVEPGVFIPRPETELLVDLVLADIASRPPGTTVLDLCTGSGSVAVAVAAAAPAARLYAGDIDPAAVALARRNAAANGVAAFIDVRESDLAAAFADLEGRVDVLTANPPYIDPALADSLPVEVRFGDPPRALFDPEGGVGFHRRIAREGRRLLRAGGAIFLEIGEDQGVKARRILADEGYGAIRIVPDLAGRDRVACGRVEPSTQSS
jgi:release factor glutamine methyltransferase